MLARARSSSSLQQYPGATSSDRFSRRSAVSPHSTTGPPLGASLPHRGSRGEDMKSEGTSRVTWEIQPVGDSCLLKVTHDELREDANNQLYGGWPMVLSGIKTLLEPGEMLTTPGSLRWLQGVQEQLPKVGRSMSR